MTEHEIRQHMHRILDSHDQALAAIRAARASMHDAQVSMAGAAQAQDDAIVSAIEANRAALQLLNQMMDEGIQ